MRFTCPGCGSIAVVDDPPMTGMSYRANCLKCGGLIDAPVLVLPTDAHHTASTLIAEITDLRAQLAGEKATNARLQGLLNQATVRIVELDERLKECGTRGH